MMSNEFALHASVADMLALLNLKSSPEEWIDALSCVPRDSVTDSTPNVKRNKIAKLLPLLKSKYTSLNPRERSHFTSFQERLSSQKSKELEPLVILLNQLESIQENQTHMDAMTFVSDGQTLMNTPSKSLKSASFQNLSSFKTPSMIRESKSMSTILTPMNASGTYAVDGSILSGARTPTIKSHLINTSLNKSKKASPLGPRNIQNQESRNLKDLSLKEQEAWIIEDLLYVLMGMDGEFIQVKSKKNQVGLQDLDYMISDSLDPSLKDLTSKIIDLAACYSTISSYIEIRSDFQFGQVNHALCACLKVLLREYLVLIAQLEHQAHVDFSFSLQKVWFYLSPSLNTMQTLKSILVLIYNKDNDKNLMSKSRFGGARILNILSERMIACGGDPQVKKLCLHLLERASVPYIKMLHKWIFTGQISDPFHEFMIHEAPSITKDVLQKDYSDVYWEQKYTLVEDCIPTLFESVQTRILFAGKYLNVLRECQVDIPGKQMMMEIYDKHMPNMNTKWENSDISLSRCLYDIEVSFLYSNVTLLDFYIQKTSLIDKLKNLKMYFLMEKSDYLVNYFDVAIQELIKPVEQISREKLQTLFELTLRSTCLDPSLESFRDLISIQFDSMSLFEKLLKINSVAGIDVDRYMHEVRTGTFTFASSSSTSFAGATQEPIHLLGTEAFTLDISVEFPLSLILNKKVITKYQLLFRQLFLCKYIERLLSGCWMDHVKLRQSFKHVSRETDSSVRDEILFIGQLSCLTEKMLHFIQQFMYYMFVEVIDPNWVKLEKSISSSMTVNQVMTCLDDFLDTCLKEVFATNPKLIKAFNKIIHTCKSFIEFSEWYCRFKTGSLSTRDESNKDVTISLQHSCHPSSSIQGTSSQIHQLGIRATPASSNAHLARLEKDFSRQICLLMDLLQVYTTTETPSLGNLAIMMDFNLFYSQQQVPDVGFISSPAIKKVNPNKYF